jgi:hypothetical protein
MPSRQVLAASALVASALTLSAPAQATTFAGSGSTSITNGTGAFYDSAIPAGTFTDTIDFTVPTTGTADVGVIYLKTVTGIKNLTALFNGSAINFVNLGGTLYSGGLSKPVSAGPQTISISGLSGGAGSYSGNVTFSAAVPELATWLMMIAGVGFTGFAMRRRKSGYQVNYAF